MAKYPIDLDIILVVWLISIFLLVYSLYYQFRKTTLSERSVALKLTIYSSIMVILLYFIYYEHFIIYLATETSYGIGLLWMLMVALITYMFLNVSGVGKTKTNNNYELIIIIALVFFSISGFGYFGIRIDIKEKAFIYNYLYYHSFQTNSYRGIKFIAYNWFFVILFFFISFLTEREI